MSKLEKIIYYLLIFVLLQANVTEAKPNKGFTRFGDIGQVVIPVSVLFISWFKDDTEGIKQFAKSYISGTAITYAFKILNKLKKTTRRETFISIWSRYSGIWRRYVFWISIRTCARNPFLLSSHCRRSKPN